MRYRALHLFMADTLSVKILLFWHTETSEVLNGDGTDHGINLEKRNLNWEIMNWFLSSISISKTEDTNRLLIWLCIHRFMFWWFYCPLEFLFQVQIFYSKLWWRTSKFNDQNLNSYSVQSGEKMGFQITLLLATFFYVDYFQANMPTFSGQFFIKLISEVWPQRTLTGDFF